MRKNAKLHGPAGLSWRIALIVVVLLAHHYSSQQSFAHTDQTPGVLQYRFFSEFSLEQISRGAVGQGTLVYFHFENGDPLPRIAVVLSKGGAGAPAVARVFMPSDEGDTSFILREEGGVVSVAGDALLAVEMIAPDGWWVRNGVFNYNLDIKVYGNIPAMWGATPDVRAGQESNWPQLLAPDEPNAHIVVRDTDGDGLPDWDWRTMVPELPNRSDRRTNYAERKCTTPVEVDPGVSPDWPFVAVDGGFEQEPGRFRPPIVVDWESGRVEYFSELVTVRNQNCSYSLYSISRVEPGELNHPNFETPFAFYDLSGGGVGYPNLLLRTQRTVKDDETLFLESNPETQSIRYSWRNQVGDGRWDYKVEVLGQHRYSARTPIAGGAALIDAPAYEVFPTWVVEREWPVAVFIGTGEGGSYRSSEGIYEWSPLGLSREFYFGWQAEPDLSRFADIPVGLRGEVRVKVTQPPNLYFSPVDNRLHLKWAEHGIWRLNDEQIIRVTNLDNDEVIDHWSREALPAIVEEDPRTQALDRGEPAPSLDESTVAGDAPPEPRVVESVYALDNHLLHSDRTGVTLVAADFEPVLFETLPPTDHESWEAHRSLLAPYEDRRRDSADLGSWLGAFPGVRSELQGASVANVRPTAYGFRFEMTLEDGFGLSGQDVLGAAALQPDRYLVEYDGNRFIVAPLAAPELSIAVDPTRASPDTRGAASTYVVVENTGGADASDVQLVVSADRGGDAVAESERTSLDVFAGETARRLVDLPANLNDGSDVYAWVESAEGERLTEQYSLASGRRAATGYVGRPFASLRIVSVGQVFALAALLVSLLLLLVAGARTMLSARN